MRQGTNSKCDINDPLRKAPSMPHQVRIRYEGALYHVMARGNRREPMHLSPARAGLVAASRGEGLIDYPWSSVARGYSAFHSSNLCFAACVRGWSSPN